MKTSKCEHCGQSIRKIPEPEYRIWQAVKARCLNPNNVAFHRYGGRGITICDRWKNSFSKFLEDMGPRPSNRHTIEREDNNGNYEPGNCRWATYTEQANNKSTTVWITINNETKNLQEWSNISGVPAKTIRKRIKAGVNGIDLIEPNSRSTLYKLDNSLYTIAQLSTMYGIRYSALRCRLKELGWDVVDAVTIPLKEFKLNDISANTEVTYRGKQISLSELSKISSLHVKTLINRVSKGLGGDELTAPGKSITTFEYQGNRLTLAEIAELSGISATILFSNIQKWKMSAEEVVKMFEVTDLSYDRVVSKNLVVYQGQLLSVREFSELVNIHADTLRRRIDLGASLDDLFRKPSKSGLYHYQGDDLTIPQISKLTGIAYATLLHRLTKQNLTIAEATASVSNN